MAGIDEHTKLLIRQKYNSQTQAWEIRDVSRNDHAITNNGVTVGSEGSGPWGTAERGINFVAASSAYLSISNADAADLQAGAGEDFGIDFWAKHSAFPTAHTGYVQKGIYDNYAGKEEGWRFSAYAQDSPNTLTRFIGGDYSTYVDPTGRFYLDASIITATQWNHHLAERKSGVIYYYFNGVVAETVAWAKELESTWDFLVGLMHWRINTTYYYNYLDGAMSEIRYMAAAPTGIQGDPLYIPDGESGFTPPSAPYSAISSGYKSLIDGFPGRLIQ